MRLIFFNHLIMKRIASVLFFFVCFSVVSQERINSKDGVAAEGYDVVAYFYNTAIEGNDEFTSMYQGISYKFASKTHLNCFEKNPKQYLPAYGGYCAYAIADTGEKVGVNPKTFKIINNRLYLFYNSWGVNTLKKWNKKGDAVMQEIADKNWKNSLN